MFVLKLSGIQIIFILKKALKSVEKKTISKLFVLQNNKDFNNLKYGLKPDRSMYSIIQKST